MNKQYPSYMLARILICHKMKPEEEWNERVFLRWYRKIARENLQLTDELKRKVIDDFTVYNVK